jgi:hypothetical protein
MVSMRDLFSEGLLYLDLLEVYGSSHVVGEVCGIAQSNAYRGAKACAKILNLDLTKRDGSYQAGRNLDVQRDLRSVAQRLRAREAGRLRWVADACVDPELLRLSPELVQELPKRWLSARRSIELLEQGLLDLVLSRRLDVAAPLALPVSLPLSRPQAREPFGLLALSEDPLLIYSGPSHPLQRQASITVDDLKGYPSPALALDADSVYAQECSHLNLWSQPLSDRFLEPAAWECLVQDQRTVVPSTPRAVASAQALVPDLQIRPLNIHTGLVDQDLLIFPLALAREPRLQEVIRAVHAAYQTNAKVFS